MTTTIELTPPVRDALARFGAWLQTRLDDANARQLETDALAFQDMLNTVQRAKEGDIEAVKAAFDARAVHYKAGDVR